MARVTVDSGAVGVVVPAALAALLLEVGPIDATRLPGHRLLRGHRAGLTQIHRDP